MATNYTNPLTGKPLIGDLPGETPNSSPTQATGQESIYQPGGVLYGLQNPGTPNYGGYATTHPNGTQAYNAASAAGYQWDPVQGKFTRTPQSAGQNVSTFGAAAIGGQLPASLQGLMNVTSGPGSSGSPGSGTAVPSSGAYGLPPGVSPAAGGVAPIQMPDMSAANGAAFAQAKDKVGATSRASLTALNDELGSKGMNASGAAVQGTRDILQSGAGALGAEANQEAIKGADLANTNATTNYQGKITQRGQDIQSQEANAQLQLSREQAAQTNLYRMLTLATQGIGGGSSSSSSPYLY